MATNKYFGLIQRIKNTKAKLASNIYCSKTAPSMHGRKICKELAKKEAEKLELLEKELKQYELLPTNNNI